jgi:hypothetical protein
MNIADSVGLVNHFRTNILVLCDKHSRDLKMSEILTCEECTISGAGLIPRVSEGTGDALLLLA